MDKYIDIYCERLGPGLWAEPLNAVTNLSFFIAALFALLLARRERTLNIYTGWLILMIAVIGLGSTLFHTFATRWAMLSDTIPIGIYQISFVAIYARFVLEWRVFHVLILVVGFIAASIGVEALPREWLNGSLGYAPALLLVIAFGIMHLRRFEYGRFALIGAALTFLVSFTFRSLDMQLCDSFPIGTHFMWHILNGLVLYLTMRALILCWQRP